MTHPLAPEAFPLPLLGAASFFGRPRFFGSVPLALGAPLGFACVVLHFAMDLGVSRTRWKNQALSRGIGSRSSMRALGKHHAQKREATGAAPR